MENNHIRVSDSQQIKVEDIFDALIMYIIKKPKGLLVFAGFIGIIVVFMYFSFIRAQNSMLIDSLKVLQSTAQISDTITKKVKEIETKAELASCDIDERIKKLDEVEHRFKEKREEIKKIREETDSLLKELSTYVQQAHIKLDQIESQQTKTQEVYDVMQKQNKSQFAIPIR